MFYNSNMFCNSCLSIVAREWFNLNKWICYICMVHTVWICMDLFHVRWTQFMEIRRCSSGQMDESPSVEVGILMPKALTGKGFCDLDQNNPIYKFDTFSQLFRPACITKDRNSGCIAHFWRLTRWAKKIFISKILQNLGVQFESHQTVRSKTLIRKFLWH